MTALRFLSRYTAVVGTAGGSWIDFWFTRGAYAIVLPGVARCVNIDGPCGVKTVSRLCYWHRLPPFHLPKPFRHRYSVKRTISDKFGLIDHLRGRKWCEHTPPGPVRYVRLSRSIVLCSGRSRVGTPLLGR